KVTIFPCYFVNDYNFQTERYSIGKSTINCAMCVKSSSYTNTNIDFYGILKEIIQLDYPLISNMQIALFKCRWVDPMRGMKVHPRYQLVDVNYKKVDHKNEPFILTQQSVQVYYTQYLSIKRDKVDWMAVCKIKARRVIDDSRWTEVAFQEDETIPTPQVVPDNHNYELHDLMVYNYSLSFLSQTNKEQVHPILLNVNLITNLTKTALTRITRLKKTTIMIETSVFL
ncbi:UNVERIFIED_CONTAM: hypothetical protein Slati_3707900, partial [Sesamum latifolium]